MVYQMPEEPTNAPPGSEAKIKVMTERVERGETPCHPGDVRVNGRTEYTVPTIQLGAPRKNGSHHGKRKHRRVSTIKSSYGYEIRHLYAPGSALPNGGRGEPTGSAEVGGSSASTGGEEAGPSRGEDTAADSRNGTH